MTEYQLAAVKQLAYDIGAMLSAQGVNISRGHVYELIAARFGYPTYAHMRDSNEHPRDDWLDRRIDTFGYSKHKSKIYAAFRATE